MDVRDERDTGRAVARERVLRRVRALVGAYFGLSLLTMVTLVLLRHDSGAVNDAAWVRGSIVAASAAVMYLCAARALRGSRRAYRRLRVLSAVMTVAIVVVVALPGMLPLWMRAEQALCGLALLGVVTAVNGRLLRAAFGAR